MKTFTCDAVIFDLDGVLVDSQECVERLWREWAARRNVDWPTVVRVAPGRRTAETVALVAPHLDADEETAALSHAEATDTDGVHPVAGARDLLTALGDRGWAVATSGDTATATNRLRVVGLPIPTVLVTADDVTRGKPDPDPYLLAADGLGVQPDHCLVLEDTPAGVAAGRAARMHVVGVASTHRPEDLQAAHAVVRKLADVTVTGRTAAGFNLRISDEELGSGD